MNKEQQKQRMARVVAMRREQQRQQVAKVIAMKIAYSKKYGLTDKDWKRFAIEQKAERPRDCRLHRLRYRSRCRREILRAKNGMKKWCDEERKKRGIC